MLFYEIEEDIRKKDHDFYLKAELIKQVSFLYNNVVILKNIIKKNKKINNYEGCKVFIKNKKIKFLYYDIENLINIIEEKYKILTFENIEEIFDELEYYNLYNSLGNIEEINNELKNIILNI